MPASPRSAGPDPRFYASLGPSALREIAQLGGGMVPEGISGEAAILAALPLDEAGEDAIAFVADRKHAAGLAECRAAAVFVPKSLDTTVVSTALIPVANPRAAWALAAARLHQPRVMAGQTQAVHPTAELEDGVDLAPGVVIGAGAKIGRGTVVGANTVIGPGVAIGRDGRIGAGVTIGFALIGDRVTILSGARIGEAGFGAVYSAGAMMDVPQLGRVILQDGVTVGASTCIDRGAFADTVVGENTKIDNLCQIAHNVRLGRNCVLAAQTGISGSVTVGDGVSFGGKAGLADHLTIGDGAQIAAGAGVTRSVPAGETWAGYPAKPMMQWLRESAWISRAVKTRSGKGGHE